MTNQNVFNYGEYMTKAEAEGRMNFLKEGKLNVVMQTPESTIFGKIVGEKAAQQCEITFMAIKQEYAKETKATIVSEYDNVLAAYCNDVEPEVITNKREQLAKLEAEREAKAEKLEAEKAKKEEVKAQKEAERAEKRAKAEIEKAEKAAKREAEKIARDAKRAEEKAKREAEKAAKEAAKATTVVVETSVVETEEDTQQTA